MATSTFSSLPPEMQIKVAEYCESGDLFNLCLSSKLMFKILLHVLYRHIDFIGPSGPMLSYQWANCYRRKQLQFLRTVLNHPQYGQHVRSFKGELNPPSARRVKGDKLTAAEFWSGLQLLTRVKDVEVANYISAEPTAISQLAPAQLFRTATAVTLMGHMPHDLSMLILHTINPELLTYLCLDMEKQKNYDRPPNSSYLTNSTNQHPLFLGSTPGLVTPLIGRCIALKTLVIRVARRYMDKPSSSRGAAEEASWMEWAMFIQSVQGTVEKLVFDRAKVWSCGERMPPTPAWELVEHKFRRVILPIIRAGYWPCLKFIETLEIYHDVMILVILGGGKVQLVNKKHHLDGIAGLISMGINPQNHSTGSG
ncbi:hypothetical protein MMC07_007766 [Pseudocyphellaria aurata]|nr:hypothetical protein [Pseudocyphellaria aurata]